LIDLHCHILPGVDDGAETITDSLAMARLAAEDGITTIVATPHRSAWTYQAAPVDVQRLVADVQEACDRAGYALQVVRGGESFVAPDLAEQVKSGLALTINGGRYLLIEWPYDQYPPFVDQMIFDLQLRGIVPVIAHAERYRVVQHDLRFLRGLIDRGVAIQVTAGCLLGDAGPAARKLVETMLVENLAHVLASDSHSATRRPPILRAARDRASELIGPERAQAMVLDVPRQMIDDRPIELPAPVIHRQRSFWPFGRSGT
jgi:protein-tyrosine phosphatase